LSMSVEDGMKVVISGGFYSPASAAKASTAGAVRAADGP